MRVAFSGARGMVGNALAASLADDPAAEAIALSRTAGRGVDRQCPDLTTGSAEAWSGALEGADAYVHLAATLPFHARNTAESDWPLFEKANTFGALRALEGAAEGGVGRFVFVSTIGVNGIVSGRERFRATDEPNASGNYSRSKLAAERLLAEHAPRLGVELVTVRPPIVYGPGVGGRFGSLVSGVANAKMIPVGAIENRRDMIGVSNLADVLMECCRNSSMVGETYLVRDREPVSTAGLITSLADLLGVEPRMLVVPRSALRLARQTPVIKGFADRLFGDVAIDDGPLMDVSSWSPRFTVRDELTRVVEGWRAQQ